MGKAQSSQMQLYDGQGQRLFISADERARFMHSSSKAPPKVRSFCHLLLFTGCRISEALALTPINIQITDRIVAIPCLKKRGRLVVRQVPMPDELVMLLDDVHDLFHLAHNWDGTSRMDLLWPWSRSTAWRYVKAVMDDAGIVGAQATAKGLRHGFGRHAIVSNVPLHILQKWMGHSDIKTTAIYANIMSNEEMQIARQMW